MKNDFINFFVLQRSVFGVCPRSGELFRLSDCRIYFKKRPVPDWMDKLDRENEKLEKFEERLSQKEKVLRGIAQNKGYQRALRVVKRVDPVFTPKKINPDDAKVLFHPIDYVVFDGLKKSSSVKNVILLDNKSKSSEQGGIQKSIEKTVERGAYEWMTLRVQENGEIRSE